MASSRDVQEVIAKLSSSKAKEREEGVRLLSGWFEGERSIGFCKLLGQSTSKIKPGDMPHDESWPFLVTLLSKCVTLEISASKKRPPKLLMAKTLRMAIQCAEDPKFSGKELPILLVSKLLFNHIWDVIKDVPSFQMEYSIILRCLLSVDEYRNQMRRRIYCNLVSLFIHKVESSIGSKDGPQSISKDEIHRNITTLHVLLESPPGDFPESVRDIIVDGFKKIFSFIREEGKMSRKLMECVSTFLLKDGPNLGVQAMQIHESVQSFIFSSWLTTHDRGLKSSFILYARIQLRLTRNIFNGNQLLEQLIDVIYKELDHNLSASIGLPWIEPLKDDKLGALDSPVHGFMDLAAAVLYQVCTSRLKSFVHKQLKVEHATVLIEDGLRKKSWLWNAVVFFLIHNYQSRLDKSLLVHLLCIASEVLERVLNDSGMVHLQTAVLWLLRALLELSRALDHPSQSGSSKFKPSTSEEVSKSRNCWYSIWRCLTHGLHTLVKFVPILDAALNLLGEMLLRGQVGTVSVPQDMWNLRIFNHEQPMQALFFIACYFSGKGSQGAIGDVLYRRKSLLSAILDLANFKEFSNLNEQTIFLIPAAIFSLCAGFAPLLSCSSDVSLFLGDKDKHSNKSLIEGEDQGVVDEFTEYSVQALSEIRCATLFEVQSKYHNTVQLPRKISQPLGHDMKEALLSLLISDVDTSNIALSDILYICSLLGNCIYCAFITKLSGDQSVVIKLFENVGRFVSHIVSVFEEKLADMTSQGIHGCVPFAETTRLIFPSLKLFLACPLFTLYKNNDAIEDESLMGLVGSLEKLLLVFAKLYLDLLSCMNDLDMGIDAPALPLPFSISSRSSDSLLEHRGQIMDMELDVDDGSNDVDILDARGNGLSAFNFCPKEWKLEMVSAMSNFFSLSPCSTWQVLFDILRKEIDTKVRENILLILCKHFSGKDDDFSALLAVMNYMVEDNAHLERPSFNILTHINILLQTLLALSSTSKHCGVTKSTFYMVSKENMIILLDLLHEVVKSDIMNWHGRVKLVNCICSFVLLEPCIAQALIERLMSMLQDTDYRVRLFLARKIFVLFITWDGHDILFEDICSNFGFDMVRFSKGKIIKGGEISPARAPSVPVLETALVTLAHIALCSQEVEVEAVFMICTVAAMNFSQRSLTYSLLDSLSEHLHYSSKDKYLEEIISGVLSRWVSCEVSLMALVEVKDMFMTNFEVKCFMQFCCPWLLPSLILHGDMTNLNLLSQIACEPLDVLVKAYFVPIFSVCMAMHCSTNSEKEMGRMALSSSLLAVGKITESERDDLIKHHMVGIVSFLLSLASSCDEPIMPSFSKETIALTIRTVVDGFLEEDNPAKNSSLVDKINIFRPDRVFKFLVEMHYQIATAIHPRHRRHRLSSLEVLINLIGKRAALSSTSCYVITLVGQFIRDQILQEQCCSILSSLLQAFDNRPTDDISVLGEQLQFLVSKLVACCIPDGNESQKASTCSPSIISLLHQLTVDADPSLYTYIKELEPFPELDCFLKIRLFHNELLQAYSSRDNFLMFCRRSCYLPQGVLCWSFQALHRKLLMNEIIEHKDTSLSTPEDPDHWISDPEIVSAVWSLVGLCGTDDGKDISILLADFISRVGIGDPYEVVFKLPVGCSQTCPSKRSSYLTSIETVSIADPFGTKELGVDLLRLLKKYLQDESVKTIDITSRTLQGVLSTDKGQSALRSLDSYERSILEVHSKGVNRTTVEKLLDSGSICREIMTLDDPFLWCTESKIYESWICSLVFSLIGYCSDIVLRLCQDIVLLKAELAELLFPYVLVNLAARIDSGTDFFSLISAKVTEKIFIDSNGMIKSIQILLDALNYLRSFYVAEKALSTPVSHGGRTSGYGKASVLAGKKGKESPSEGLLNFSSWCKVYWLSIDYLVVARAAVRAGSYFTAVMYVEHWCEENFNDLELGRLDFSNISLLPHIELLIAAFTQINEPDSIYGITQSHKLTSQIIKYEHEGNWNRALECYDLLVRSEGFGGSKAFDGFYGSSQTEVEKIRDWKSHKGLMRSLRRTGCSHLLSVYCQGLLNMKDSIQTDLEFSELQYEAAWRAGNWDFSFLASEYDSYAKFSSGDHFNANLHSCLRALQEGDPDEFRRKLSEGKQELVLSICNSSRESTEYIYSTIFKLQILDHLGMSWNLRWSQSTDQCQNASLYVKSVFQEPVIPTRTSMMWLNINWRFIQKQAQLNLNLLEPFIAFMHSLLQILDCKECILEHLLESACILRKGSRLSLAAAALHELKLLSSRTNQQAVSGTCILEMLEEAKLLRGQGQHEMAINLGKYIIYNYKVGEQDSNVHRLVGKWLTESRSSNARTILEQYLKQAVELAELSKNTGKESMLRKYQAYFHLAHYSDGLFKSHEERLSSTEWQAAMRLRKHKTKELDALIRRLRNSDKGDKIEYSAKIQELQKQLSMDREEAEKLEDDRDNFLSIALEGYQRCLVIGGKSDLRVVFRLVSLWFSLSSREGVIKSMLSTVKEVQSYKFLPLAYQIASRLGSSKDAIGLVNFQTALASLVKKMALEHPYHSMFQLFALANGDRIKDKQRSKNYFIVDMEKKLAAEKLLNELSSCHGTLMHQMKLMVEIYIKLAELETRKEETNRRVPLPRDIRSIHQLELVPVVTATIPVDPECKYKEGSFPHFQGLSDSIMIMNGINAPKVIECLGSNGCKYRQLAKSGNDDLRQDAVMEQFFGLVNAFLKNNRDTWKRRLKIRTYKVVPFTPSAGVLEWVNGTIPLGDYLIGSTRNGGAHGRYRMGDWSFLQCREYMINEKDKRKAFLKVCENFRPVMRHFFLERFLQPTDWFVGRLSYTRSVAVSSMVGYIVGLGDRHSMNILIDQATAEVVHIDLGVAFEQGLMLKTPERVPFRLTRDIIDGMGIAGVEGVFRRCCEETISVMRTNKEPLLTIIEVFVHDPLYKWALSPLKALQRQKETYDNVDSDLENSQDAYEGNKDAARALLRVKQKLDGYEEGGLRSIEGQVQQLIQDAIDTDRLCQMFPGWGPWL